MRLFDRLRRALAPPPERKHAEETKAAPPSAAFYVTGAPAWSPRTPQAFASEGYAGNPVVHRCIRMIAEAVAGLEWCLYDGDEECGDHPLSALLARPSPFRTGGEFLEALLCHLMITGNAFAEAVRTQDEGVLTELHVLRPDRMRIVPGARGWPEAYEYAAGGTLRRYPIGPDGRSDVLHVRLFHPSDDLNGLSPMQAAAAAIDIHNEAAAWNKALLDNGARPSGALIYKGADGAAHLSPEQFARLKQELEDAVQGADNAGRPLLLEGGLSWTPMALSPADMDFLNARNAAARDIALAFGVPPMLLGIPGDNTYANYREAQLAFWRSVVVPLARRIGAALIAWLAPEGTLTLVPDTDKIEALSPDREALWARLESASFLTGAEKRVAAGYTPEPFEPPERSDPPDQSDTDETVSRESRPGEPL